MEQNGGGGGGEKGQNFKPWWLGGGGETVKQIRIRGGGIRTCVMYLVTYLPFRTRPPWPSFYFYGNNRALLRLATCQMASLQGVTGRNFEFVSYSLK